MKKLTTAVRTFFLAAPLLIVIFLGVPVARSQPGEEVLTNDEVISMVKAGLNSTVIVNKIRTSKTKFNLTTIELIRLKQSGIDDEVLMAMQGTSETPDSPAFTTAAAAESRDLNDPIVRRNVGIYLYTERDGVKKMTELESNVVTQTRIGGMIGTALTYGLWKTKVKGKIPGVSANFQISGSQPVFYFYLNEKDRTLATIKYFPSSVNQFQMVKFDVKDHGREVTVAKMNSYSSKAGIADNFLVAFSSEKIADGIFKITPRAPLKSGEYGFYLLGTGDTIGATFFDFGFRP